MIDQVEDAIIQQLVTHELKAESFPDDFDKFKGAIRKGALLVAYRRSTFDEPRTLNFIRQVRRAEFEVMLLVKGLRDHEGAYPHLLKISELLTGFRPKGADPLYPTEEEFIGKDGGLWIYGQTYVTSFPHIEKRPQETGPAFTKATFKDTANNDTLEVYPDG